MRRLRILSARFLLALALSAVAAAGAAAFPARDITYIIPFNPGGESDVTARLQDPVLRQLTGHGFIIRHKPGNGGAYAWAQLNRMPGDGYTVMGINLPHIILQPMAGDVGYRTEDMVPVYLFQATPHALVVAASSPIDSLDAFIRAARARPGQVVVAGTGLQTANHVAQQLFDEAADIATRYVPLTGTGATVEALLGKHVDAMWNFTTAGAELKGKVRLLAVAMQERHPLFPDVPTFNEKGIALTGGAERGIAVPRSTPAGLRAQLSTLFWEINHDPAFRQEMIDSGYVPIDVDHERIPAYIAARAAALAAAGHLLGLRR